MQGTKYHRIPSSVYNAQAITAMENELISIWVCKCAYRNQCIKQIQGH